MKLLLKYFIAIFIIYFYQMTFAQENTINISSTGTISFELETDRTYNNGSLAKDFSQILINLSGLGKCQLNESHFAVTLSLQWENEQNNSGYLINIATLPGPQKYSIIFTWDADKGLADGYFNGISFRMEDQQFYKPWKMIGKATNHEISDGENKINNLKILSKYVTEDKIADLVPKELFGKMTNIIYKDKFPSPIDLNKRKGKLLYSNSLDSEEKIKDWILEGPGTISFEDNSMILRSQIPNPTDFSAGHFNYWCPVDFPDNIIVEWEIMPLTELGVCHLFFAARGQNGEVIFDSSLPERDGHYGQYHSGAINNYFIIYYSNLRSMRTSNMATTSIIKSNKPALLSLGQIGINPGNKEYHKIRLIKEGGHIQLQVNDKIVNDFVDPGNEQWGQIYGGGKISFRQMAVFAAASVEMNESNITIPLSVRTTVTVPPTLRISLISLNFSGCKTITSSLT